MALELKKRLITVDEYYRMAEAGVFKPNERVELIAGEIIEMSPIGKEHAYAVNQLHRFFSKNVGDDIIISSQNPAHLGDTSEPQPDLILVKNRPELYKEHHPEPGDILLLIEVAHTTLSYDRQIKLPLYARFCIKEYWLVNLVDKEIEVYLKPEGDPYAEKKVYSQGENVIATSLPNNPLETISLFI